MNPDPFDTMQFPYGKRAGDNKYGLEQCPTCRRPPTHPTSAEYPFAVEPPPQGFYMFRDELSCREYYISGMCQHCQDAVFNSAIK